MSIPAVRTGIVSYGAYLPCWRLQRTAIAQVLGSRAGTGARRVASYDEDTTTLAVEAARVALARRTEPVAAVLLATASPAYQDKTNATAVAAALQLGTDVLAADLTGAVRSGVAALHAGLRGDGATLVLLSDVRGGLPGSDDETRGGDAAAALVVGPSSAGPLVAEYLGGASVSDEFLDRWRSPGDTSSHTWEERFGETAYLPLATRALSRALTDTGLSVDDLDRVVLAGLHERAARSFAKASSLRAEQLADTLARTVGNTGTAQPGLGLAAVLDEAEPGQVVALIVLADGADVLLFRATEHLPLARSVRPVAAQVASGRDVAYPTYLSWRGHLDRQPPRRPEPDRPAGPPSHRTTRWKFGLTGTTCQCGQRHLPPQRVCVRCGVADAMTEQRLADVPATVATYTVDHLAPSPSPPLVAAVLDLDGGGRFSCELTDADPDEVRVGTRVEMTFRRLYTAGGVHNYFWKARPVAGEGTSG